MELQEVVDEEGRLESTHSFVGLLCGLAEHRASNKLLAFLDLQMEVRKTVLTERVQTGQCPGLSVAIQADWTGQLLLEIIARASIYIAVGAFSAIETSNSNKLVEYCCCLN